jgi:hypothetical protein
VYTYYSYSSAVSTTHSEDVVLGTWFTMRRLFLFAPPPHELWARIVGSRKHAAVFVAPGFQRTASILIYLSTQESKPECNNNKNILYLKTDTYHVYDIPIRETIYYICKKNITKPILFFLSPRNKNLCI